MYHSKMTPKHFKQLLPSFPAVRYYSELYCLTYTLYAASTGKSLSFWFPAFQWHMMQTEHQGCDTPRRACKIEQEVVFFVFCFFSGQLHRMVAAIITPIKAKITETTQHQENITQWQLQLNIITTTVDLTELHTMMGHCSQEDEDQATKARTGQHKSQPPP